VAAPPLKEAEEQVRVRVEREKRIRGKVGREKAKKLSKKYNKQSCYLLLIYEPQAKTPTDAIPVRTQPTLEAVLKDLEELGLYPLIHPQRVYVPQSFWEEYRLAQSSSQRLELVRKYGLLRDSSIYRFDTVVIDVDSPFESVYPAFVRDKNASRFVGRCPLGEKARKRSRKLNHFWGLRSLANNAG